MSASASGAQAPGSADPASRAAIGTLESIRSAEWPLLDESMIVASEIDIHCQERAPSHARRAVNPALRLRHAFEEERRVAKGCNGVDPKRDRDVRVDSQPRDRSRPESEPSGVVFVLRGHPETGSLHLDALDLRTGTDVELPHREGGTG